MSSELYFIYDSHCPWSYAVTPLVVSLQNAFPEMEIHAWHCAHFDGSNAVPANTIKSVQRDSYVKISDSYLRLADKNKSSIVCANLLTWVANKQSDKLFDVLQALQKAHFEDANPLAQKEDFDSLSEQLKLSIPHKVFKDELSKDALFTLSDINDLQDFIGTVSFPALLHVVNDNAVLINHAQYLKDVKSLIAYVRQLQA